MPSLGSPDYAYIALADSIYGGMFGSRLIRNIREDKGYTYSPGSNASTRRFSGMLITREDVRNEVTGASFKETVAELNRMGSVPPSDFELANAKRNFIGVVAISLQSHGALANQLSREWVQDQPPTLLDDQIAKIQAATAQDIAKVGTK